jgi:hypothetical protein
MIERRRLVFVASLVAVLSATGGSLAASLPPVEMSADNAVPACATPGRLMAYLRTRNPNLDSRYANIAAEYMRHGQVLGVRWDYGFYQMILETGSLAYKRGNGKPSDVRPEQNNFAGLGATGNGEHGESFADISTGVRAHLEHILMYAGRRIESPAADRTRKVQEWGVLTAWQKGFKQPITFGDLGRKWAPGDRGYSASIESIAAKFEADQCGKPDPAPGMVALARSDKVAVASAAAAAASAPATPPADPDRISGADLAREAVERARAEGDSSRSSLGAGTIAKTASVTKPPVDGSSKTPATELGTAKTEPAEKPSVTQTSAGAGAGASSKRTASAAPKAPTPDASKCRVWTASYGGQKTVIISSNADGYTNYTVLEVNENAEARETEAYIAAYAKNGQKIADFPTQQQALDKAFQLCPEG